jgi:hypothetical protein
METLRAHIERVSLHVKNLYSFNFFFCTYRVHMHLGLLLIFRLNSPSLRESSLVSSGDMKPFVFPNFENMIFEVPKNSAKYL